MAVDGFSSYLKAFRRTFRAPFYTGKVGRPKLIAWPKVAIAQVIKKRSEGVLEIERRIVQGCEVMIGRVLQSSQGGGCLNTAYIERL